MKIVNRYPDMDIMVYVSDWRYFIGIDIELKFPYMGGKFHSDRIIIGENPFSAIKGL